MHAGQAAGPGSVDAPDAGVGMRTGEELGVQHAAQLDIVCEGRAAASQLHRINLGRGMPHDGKVRLRLRLRRCRASVLRWKRLPALQDFRCLQHRLDRLDVARAAAENAA